MLSKGLPATLEEEILGIVSGGSVALDFEVIGARFLGAAMRGLSFDSSNGASCKPAPPESVGGIVGSGINFCFGLPVSGIGFTLTTAVTIAGAGKLDDLDWPVGPGITYVACVVEGGMIDGMLVVLWFTGVSRASRGLALFFFLRKSKFNLPVFLSFSSFDKASTSFSCLSSSFAAFA